MIVINIPLSLPQHPRSADEDIYGKKKAVSGHTSKPEKDEKEETNRALIYILFFILVPILFAICLVMLPAYYAPQPRRRRRRYRPMDY